VNHQPKGAEVALVPLIKQVDLISKMDQVVVHSWKKEKKKEKKTKKEAGGTKILFDPTTRIFLCPTAKQHKKN